MPLLRFYQSPNLLTPDEKKRLSRDLTAIYVASGLPAFYVNVIFLDVPPDSLFVGGEETHNFVRICIEHIALKFPNADLQQRYMKRLDDIIVPIFEPKGLNWEYHIDETPRELWKLQSIVPPPHLSEAHHKWVKENKATPWEKAEL
jgi:phenylpyruvate tautomerase PptA (4-oxalocrotonate tautomerase family)